MMQIFFNETSLNSQYTEKVHFINALKLFLSSIKRISEIKNNKEIFKSDSFFYYTGLEGTFLDTVLKKNPALNLAFVQNMQLVNPKNWERQKKHVDDSSYNFSDRNYVGTSVAELAERKIQDDTLAGFLLNFTDSQFGDNPQIDILKNGKEAVIIDCTISPESVEEWLVTHNYINPNEIYDESSGIPPSDIQTVLRDITVFEKTNYPRNNGRLVYRKIGMHELWSVDGAIKHAGAKAHIEVFDEKTGKHLGTSIYNEIRLDSLFKKEDRSLNKG